MRHKLWLLPELRSQKDACPSLSVMYLPPAMVDVNALGLGFLLRKGRHFEAGEKS